MKEPDDKASDSLPILKAAFQKTIPVMFGYIPLGIAFGFLLTQAGYFWLYAVLMSIVIYSGATQFLAIGLFANHAALIEIAVTTLLLNIRHSFFGLSLIRKFTGEAPFTSYFTEESPGRAVVWTGFRIIERYMNNNPDVTMQELMSMTDCQSILGGAKYNPN